MALPETVVEEQNTILDLEQDLMEKKEGVKSWKEIAATWKEIAEDNKKIYQRSFERVSFYKEKLERMESLWRDHLNECDPQDDNEWEAQARQILYNDSDAVKQIAAEGYDRSEVEDVPF